MGCASNRNQYGFTLVEISIVMIIIGLLIGGTFGGMKLIENMQVNKTVQDLKSIESAALTFKDTYGRLPGDIRNPAIRLPNCTDTPCATAGNGDRTIDGSEHVNNAITTSSERYTFWHHLLAADLLAIGIKPTLDMSFGEGQPDLPIGGGIRMSWRNSTMWGVVGAHVFQGAILMGFTDPSGLFTGADRPTPCGLLASADAKMDDGLHWIGNFTSGYCNVSANADSGYNTTGSGVILYDLKGF